LSQQPHPENEYRRHKAQSHGLDYRTSQNQTQGLPEPCSPDPS
jgi:hypothetical protein